MGTRSVGRIPAARTLDRAAPMTGPITVIAATSSLVGRTHLVVGVQPQDRLGFDAEGHRSKVQGTNGLFCLRLERVHAGQHLGERSAPQVVPQQLCER